MADLNNIFMELQSIIIDIKDIIFNEFSLSIIGSVLATYCLMTFSKIYTNIISPWFNELKYQGVTVPGAWRQQIFYTADEECNESDEYEKSYYFRLYLIQHGNSFSGTFSEDHKLDISKSSAGKNAGGVYNIDGHIQDGIITLSLFSQSSSSSSYGTLMLRVEAGGKGLVGIYCYRSSITNEIKDFELALRRY